MIKIKNLDDLLENNLKGKTVYLRADLNLPTINGKVTDCLLYTSDAADD